MFLHNPDSPPFSEDGSTTFELGASAGDGAVKTLHTPELLNSLITLAPPAFPASYSQYQETSAAASASTAPASSAAATPSLQQTTSELIKEGLKVSIRSRRASCGQGLFTDEKRDVKSELTSLDEARRQRRRERNKVAATKCRNKKKLETQHLIVDSEVQVNQHNSLRLEIMQLLQERSQLMTALTSHLTCCTSSCADSTAQTLSRCRHTPPPEVPRPLSPLTPITSPDSERRASGSSTCSWSSAPEMPLDVAACPLPYGGTTVAGGFPCGGSVMTNNMAMTPSPTASVSPNFCSGPGGGQFGSMCSPTGAMPPPAALMMSPPTPCPPTPCPPTPCPPNMSPPACAGAAGMPPCTQQAAMTPAPPPLSQQPVKMGLNSPSHAVSYPMSTSGGGYMQQTPVSTPIGGGQYQYYGCTPPMTPQSCQSGFSSQAQPYGPYSTYGQMC